MTTALEKPPAMPPITGRSPVAMRRVYASAERGALLGFIVNLVLAIGKLAAGLLSGSFVLIADAVNSMGDVLASTVVLGSLRFAQRPPDAEHPYGHTRIEAIAGALVSMLILISAGIIAWEAMQRIGLRHGAPPGWTLWVAGTTVVIKEMLYHYKWRLGQKTGSQAIKANAWDHRADALSALAVLVGLALVRFGGEAWGDADEVAALVAGVDLVVTVCTAIVHLAGALGKTAWVMVPAVAEWRYLESGAHIPWYPALRLFRQQKLTEWDEVIAIIGAELQHRVAGVGALA